MKIQIHQPAPNFTAIDQNNKTHQLSDYLGQWVVLYFYPKDNTPGCTKEACAFRDNLSELKKIAVVIGVSAQSLESHQKFANKFELNFPILADQDKTIINLYGVNGVLMPKRVTFLIDPTGVVRKIYPKVDVNEHVQEVIRDLKELAD